MGSKARIRDTTAWAAFLTEVTDPAHKAEFTAQIAACQAKPGFQSIRL